MLPVLATLFLAQHELREELLQQEGFVHASPIHYLNPDTACLFNMKAERSRKEDKTKPGLFGCTAPARAKQQALGDIFDLQ